MCECVNEGREGVYLDVCVFVYFSKASQCRILYFNIDLEIADAKKCI